MSVIQKRVWLRVSLMVIVGGLFVAVVYGQGQQQEPIATIGLPVTNAQTSILDRWLRPEVVMLFVTLITYLVDLRGDLRRLKADVLTLQEFREEFPKELAKTYMSRELVDARFREHQRFAKRDRDSG